MSDIRARHYARFDHDARAMYLRLDGKPEGTVIPGCRTKQVQADNPMINVDYDGDGNCVGVEVIW